MLAPLLLAPLAIQFSVVVGDSVPLDPASVSNAIVSQLFNSGHWNPSARGGFNESGWTYEGPWQVANLVEAFANFLISVPESSSLGNNHTYVAQSIQHTFSYFNASGLIDNNTQKFEASQYDDLLWWALAYVRTYELCLAKPELMPCTAPGGGSLLDSARTIFDYTYDVSWNTDYCGGGFAWSLGTPNFKNCVTSQLGVTTAAKLALLLEASGHGDSKCNCKAQATYRTIALDTSAWLIRAPMRNTTTGLFNDALSKCNKSTECPNDNGPIWTYCQGLPLGYDIFLWKLTGKASYIQDAIAIAAAVQVNLVASATWPETNIVPYAPTDRGNVLSELACDTKNCTPPLPLQCDCDSDQMIFKGIMSRYLGYLSAALPVDGPYAGNKKSIDSFLAQNAASVWNNNKDPNSYDFGLFWQGPLFRTKTAYENSVYLNMAVLDLFNSLIVTQETIQYV